MAKYLDYAGLSKYDALIKALIKKGDNEIIDFIGVLPTDASDSETVIDYFVSKIGTNEQSTVEALREIHRILGSFGDASDSDTRTVKEFLEDLEDAISEEVTRAKGAEEVLAAAVETEKTRATGVEEALAARLDTLEGDDTVEGSVAKAVKDAIDGVVDGAPEAFDTLKEIAKWIGSDKTGTAELISRVGDIEEQHASDVETLNERIDNIREEEDDAISNAEIAALFLGESVETVIKEVASAADIQAISAVQAKDVDLVVSGDAAVNALTENKTYNSVAIGSGDVNKKLTIKAEDYIVVSGVDVNCREEDATGNGSINYAAKDLTVKNVNISGNTNYNVFEGTQVLNDSEAHLENLTLENIVVSDPTIKHNIANVYTPAEGAKIRIADSQFTLNSDNSNVLRVSNYLNSENLEIVFENCDWNYVAGSAQYAGLMFYHAAGADAAVSGDLSHIATWTIKFINCRYNGVKVTANNKDMSQALYTYGINGVNKAVCGEDAITSVGWTVVFE